MRWLQVIAALSMSCSAGCFVSDPGVAREQVAACSDCVMSPGECPSGCEETFEADCGVLLLCVAPACQRFAPMCGVSGVDMESEEEADMRSPSAEVDMTDMTAEEPAPGCQVEVARGTTRIDVCPGSCDADGRCWADVSCVGTCPCDVTFNGVCASVEASETSCIADGNPGTTCPGECVGGLCEVPGCEGGGEECSCRDDDADGACDDEVVFDPSGLGCGEVTCFGYCLGGELCLPHRECTLPEHAQFDPDCECVSGDCSWSR